MRRAIARGRVFPQSYSTDRRYGRLSLKACSLFPLMWANADDQGRLCGDPEEVKYTCCPNIDHITKADVPKVLEELATNELIKVYNTSKTQAIQILDWWEVHHKMQWAWPSQYPAMDGWKDHLRYKGDSKTVVAINWPVSGESSGEGSGEDASRFPLTTLPSEKERGKGTRRGNRNRNSPESSGEKHSPPLAGLSTDNSEILHTLTQCFKQQWGRVPAHAPNEVIPREPDAREAAQLRDLAKELSAVGGCSLDYIKQAFREAAGQGKCHISYVRAVLLDWLGVERIRAP